MTMFQNVFVISPLGFICYEVQMHSHWISNTHVIFLYIII